MDLLFEKQQQPIRQTQWTLLTNYHAERINMAEDLAPSLSHIKTGLVTGAGELFFCVALY